MHGALLAPEIFWCLSSIRWLMLRTSQSNAVCVKRFAVFVWLIVLMSWRWQNRCSLPRYFLFPSFSLSLPLSPSQIYVFLSSFIMPATRSPSLPLTFFIHCLVSQLFPPFLYPSLPSCSATPPLIFPDTPLQLSIAFLVFPFFISYPLWIRIPLFNAVNHRGL